MQVTPSALARVDRAEAAVRSLLAPTDVRVRDLGEGRARLELDPVALAAVDARVLDAVRAEGFTQVVPAAFRSGSMNDVLRDAAPAAVPARP